LPDHALDSILDARDLPVNQETDGTSAQLENELTYFFLAVFAVQNTKLIQGH
jgi:hypothetical protein